jgi:galactokinase/mevalonate kinase-like predicted kinase
MPEAQGGALNPGSRLSHKRRATALYHDALAHKAKSGCIFIPPPGATIRMRKKTGKTMNSTMICIITASDPSQAAVFKDSLKSRLSRGLYPREIDFRIYSDPGSGRVGSGGGTMHALMRLLADLRIQDAGGFLAENRILIIHAGGESRRMPCFAPEGKIFAPVPVATSSLVPPTVLDLQLSLFLKYPWRNGEVIVTSGDVVVDFDTAMLPTDRGEVCGFSKPASFEAGSRHGVFRFDKDRERVVDFYQKATPEFLRASACLEGAHECAIDTGIVSFGPRAAQAFLGLAALRMGGLVSAGRLNFDLYLEIMTACLGGLSFAEYRRRLSGRTRLDAAAVRAVYDTFHCFPLTGVITRSASFLHFGALPDLHDACLELHNKGIKPFYAQENDELSPYCSPEQVLYNSQDAAIPVGRQKGVVVESSVHCSLQNLAGNNLLFGLDAWRSSFVIPDGICLDQRRIEGAPITMVYGMHDTFRRKPRIDDVIFCGVSMRDWLRRHQLIAADIWRKGETGDLLDARLFFFGAEPAFCAGYWQQPMDEGWSKRFKRERRLSIREINARDTAVNREGRRIEIRAKLMRERLARGIGWNAVGKSDFAQIVKGGELGPALGKMLAATDDDLLRAYRSTLLASVAAVPRSAARFAEINYLRGRTAAAALAPAIKDDQIVWARSPVRLDLAGGWSDTPPYTLRYGGQVLNCAVDLNGQPPIQVFCRKTPDAHVRIHSIDLGVTETITGFKELCKYRDPASPFGLPKAALSLLGLTEQNHPGRSLGRLLGKMGCGIEITLLCAVPKGSGLGTSSILAGTILGALHRFFGIACTRDDLFLQVLQMEQMLTTGGGWQDQIGGLTGGVKYIESKAGLRPQPVVHQLDPWLFLDPSTSACFTLFYTGITRLAKNILKDVVRQVNENTPAYLFTLHYMKALARAGKDAIALRDQRSVIDIIARSWQANNRVHAGTTNAAVERMLSVCAPYYRGVKLLGAGGGGYALFASDTPVQAGTLRAFLHERLENGKARIVDWELNQAGLQVTVS